MPEPSPTPSPPPARNLVRWARRRWTRQGTGGRSGRGTPPGDVVLALAAAALLFGALALFGARYHWVEEAGSAERDGYVAQAESILAGELPRDPFRPALYPLAVAGVASLVIPPFDAARLLSNLSAAALAWLAWWFGRRLAGPPAGWAAFALTAVNPNLWILGQHVTTDMPFAAVAAATLAAGLAYLEKGSGGAWSLALLVGLLLGLATFLRANGLFLVPALLVAWWLGSAGRVPSARRWQRPAPAWGHLLVAGGAAALTLAPHFALRAAAFGDPLHDENWKNLAFKLYGFPDWSYLDRVPFDGILDVVAADPGRAVAGFLEELWRFAAGGGVSQLLGTSVHAALFIVGTVVALASLRRIPPPATWDDGAFRPGSRRVAPSDPLPASRRAGSGPPSLTRRALWLLFAAASFVAAVALTFFTWGRLLLVLLPVGNALAAVPWGNGTEVRAARDALRRRGRQWVVGLRSRSPGRILSRLGSSGERLRKAGATWLPGGWAASLLLLLVALLAAKTFLFRLPAFVDRHPYAEVLALRSLAAEVPPGTVLAGTSPFLGRYLDRPYLYVPDAFGPEVVQPDLYYAGLRRLLAQSGADYLVAGPTDHRDRPRGLLAEAPPVDWLERGPPAAPPGGAEGGLRIWRVAAADAP